MAKVYQINVSPGGVPTQQVVFGRAIALPDGRKTFAGYLWAADNSHFRKFASEVTERELREMGLDGINVNDTRERCLLRVINEREDKVDHNSQDQTVCLFALERIAELRAQNYPLFPGAMGETITTEELDHAELRQGFLLSVGKRGKRGMVIRLTEPRSPCRTVEAYATVANAIEERGEGERLHLVRAVGFTKDPENPKFGKSGWYAAIEDIWGTGVVMPLDRIEKL